MTISAHGIELRAGARLLLEGATFRVGPGDKVGLVGRNGAGKTTLTRVLAGEGEPAAGTVARGGEHRLPAAGPARRRPRRARPRSDPLRARASATQYAGCARPSSAWRPPTRRPVTRRCGATSTPRPSSSPWAGTPRSPRPPRSPPASACPSACSPSRSAPCPAGSAAAWSWPASCSPGPSTLLLDEPTNHLDADSIVWLRDFLKSHRAVSSSSATTSHLLEATVNRVFHLDANRCEIDVYNVGWTRLPEAARDRRAAPQARAGQRREAGRPAAEAGRPHARQGHQGQGRAEHGPTRRAHPRRSRGDRGATTRSPSCASRRPRRAARRRCAPPSCRKSYGSLEIFTDVDLAIDRGSRVVILGLNGAGKTTLLRILAGVDEPDTGEVQPGHGLRLGYYAQEHETLDPKRTVLENMRTRRARPARARDAQGARLVPVLRRRRRQAGRHALRRREDPPRPGHARGVRRPTSCCSTSRRTTSTRPAARRSSARCARTRARSSW